MNVQLNKAQINNLILYVEAGKDDEELANLLNIAPETAAKYRASFCPKVIPSDDPPEGGDAPTPKKAPAKKAKARKRK